MTAATLPRRTLRSAADLVAAGLLPPEHADAVTEAARALPIAVTPALLALIDPADAADPIARQFVPSPRELELAPEDLADPIGDTARSPVKGIVHRYPDRVLLKPLLACPFHCRFCFRRDQIGDGALGEAEMDAAVAYIAARPRIWEVILTGGDPLMLSPARLRAIMARLAGIAHVQVVRIHSRVPIGDPARLTDDLAAALRCGDKAGYVVLHCNHPRELSDDALKACDRLRRAGAVLLAQTVLLRGVNADPDTLESLMRALVRNGIPPYYLHHPDLVRGTGHFRLSVAEGQALVATLRQRLSGLCQPTYVLDIPGGHGKVPLAASHFDPETHRVVDPRGNVHPYAG